MKPTPPSLARVAFVTLPLPIRSALVILAGVWTLAAQGQANPPAPIFAGDRPNLTGQVLAKGGGPLPVPATVFIATAAPKSGTSSFCPSCYADCAKHTRTDQQGSFKIESLDPQLTFQVLAVAKGYQPKYVSKLDPAKGTPVAELTESDYDALVLRFFNNQDLKEVGRALGVSDDTAQKRVARALDKLRENLTRRGVATTGAALSLAISTNAVSVAPAGLAATIATAAALAGTTLATTATATAIKTIAMTTLQKTVITAALAAAVGTGIYEARRATKLQSEVQVLQQQQAALTGQIQQLASERDDAARQRSVIDDNSKRSNVDTSELLRLRGEVGLLRRQIAATRSTQETPTNQIQFTLPYSRREAWSDKGTADPLNTILTMFWAIGQSDETKLGQIVSRGTSSQSLDQLTLPKRDWNNIAGIQIVNVSTAQLMMEGRLQESANIDVIVEKALPVLDRTEKDFNVRRWMLTKANDQWLITGAR